MRNENSLLNQSFLSTADLESSYFQSIVDQGLNMKSNGSFGPSLAGLNVGLVFFNSSLRTRTSMMVAVNKLGGHPIVLDIGNGTWSLETQSNVVMNGDKPEHIREAIPVLSRYVDILGVRCFPGMKNILCRKGYVRMPYLGGYLRLWLVSLQGSALFLSRYLIAS